MNLYLQDSTAQEIKLSPVFISTPGAFSRNRTYRKIYGPDGEDAFGDGSVSGFDISLEYTALAQTDTAFRNEIRNLVRFIMSGNEPFYLVDKDNNLRQKVDPKGFDPKASVNMRVAKPVLTVRALQPFKEDLAENQTTQSGIVNNSTVLVDVGGDFRCFPIIQLVAVLTTSEFRVTNTTNGSSVQIIDGSFTPGGIYIMDSTIPAFTLNGTNRDLQVSDGGVLFFSPGVNTLSFTIPIGEVNATINWRSRYAV